MRLKSMHPGRSVRSGQEDVVVGRIKTKAIATGRKRRESVGQVQGMGICLPGLEPSALFDHSAKNPR